MTDTLASGSLALAALIAIAAGFMSFASPCVLPLVPSYVAYVASSVNDGSARNRRVVWGALSFIAGFSVVFLSYGAIFGAVGHAISANRVALERVLGVVVIVLGLAFMGGISWLQSDRRPHGWSATGRVGAVVLGIAFGLGWSPCIGPALAAVQTLAFSSATASRGALLSSFYCLGLGIPFILIAVFGQRFTAAMTFLRRHTRLINRVGGSLLIAMGLLLVTGLWSHVVVFLQGLVPGWNPPW